MSYYPFFRGKQYELVVIREKASRLSEWGMAPIVEPVKDGLTGLQRAVAALSESGCEGWVIANPKVGMLKGENLCSVSSAQDFCRAISESATVNWLYQVVDEGDLAGMAAFLAACPGSGVLHHGDVAASQVVEALTTGNQLLTPAKNFFRNKCVERYRSKFVGPPSIKVEDGFERRLRNSDYPDDEFFSDTLLTYSMSGFAGFSDYLIVGHDFLEGGGPALTVAIHLTYRNPLDEGALHIRHFKSDSNATAENPAEKFAEALTKLVSAVDQSGSPIMRTAAVEEFFALHASGHFPGLGYVKKLSMQHHLELLSER